MPIKSHFSIKISINFNINIVSLQYLTMIDIKY